MSAYTKGPWRAEVWDYSQSIPPRKELNVQNETNLIATLQCDYTGDNPYTIPQAEAEANARLFAAAPVMYEALKSLYEHCAMTHKHWGENSNSKEADLAIKQGEEALRLAEGRG